MDAKELLISVGGFHSAMRDTNAHAIVTSLVARMRENMETMLPAFPYRDSKERQCDIEKLLIFYELGIKDGIEEWIKNKQTNNKED